MHPSIFWSSFMYFVIIIFFLDQLPASYSKLDAQYQACSGSFPCANFTDLDYPFWGGDRAAHCGHPAFQLDCRGDVPFIAFQSRSYRVLAIDTRTLTITVARQDLWNTTCPSRIYNTDLDYRYFRLSSNYENLTLSYGCSTVPRQSHEFDCRVNESSSVSYFFTEAALLANNQSQLNCTDSILVPVNQTSAWLLTPPTSSEDDLMVVLKAGFDLRWEANDTSCDQCAQSGGRCGYYTNTSSFSCYCSNRRYPSLCKLTDSGGRLDKGSKFGPKFIVGGVVGVGILFSVSIIYYYLKKTKHGSSLISQNVPSHPNDVEAFIRQYGSSISQRFRYATLKKITNSFTDEIGKGGYGNVYRGRLADGRVVAVKVLHSSKGNGEDFVNEVASIGRTSHVNVVTLLGYCYEGKRRALIYEFMPNGSLEKFIYDKRPTLEGQHLGWEKLYSIALGIARGLEYLHRGCNTRIVHFDIKPHNILLDEDFRPKISDFGLAKLYNTKESAVSSLLNARGTIGYIAPEITSRNFGQVSHKSDVYSYGMMILEMVGGRKNVDAGVDHTSQIYYPRWLYKRIQFDDVLDMGNEISKEENELVRKMLIVGLWCIQVYPTQRPSIGKVIEMLEGQISALEMPPSPYLCSEPNSPSNS